MTGRALITGAEGFVGGHLQNHLQEQGWDVVPVSLAGIGGTLRCDITNQEQVNDLFDRAGEVTHVFHLAAVAFVPQASASPNLAFQVNLEGTVNLMAALHARGARARFVNVGSSAVYGAPRCLPVDEEHPLNPVDPYGISKAAADHYGAFMHATAGLDVVRLRPFNHSGPGQPPDYALPAFARQLVLAEREEAEPVVRVGNLDARRDFLHVGDVVRAYECAALRGKPGAAYNICSGEAFSLREGLDRLIALSERQVRVETDPARMRPADVPEIRGSHDRLSADTGWQPEIPFSTLLEDLIRWWRQQPRTKPNP